MSRLDFLMMTFGPLLLLQLNWRLIQPKPIERQSMALSLWVEKVESGKITINFAEVINDQK